MKKLRSALAIRVWSNYQEQLFSFKSQVARNDFRAAILQEFAATTPNYFFEAVEKAAKETAKAYSK